MEINRKSTTQQEHEGSAFVALPGLDLTDTLRIEEDGTIFYENCVILNRPELQMAEKLTCAY
jgi:hypothetical protein